MSNPESNRFDAFATSRLRRAGWIVLLCGALFAAGASAQTRMKSLMNTLETGTRFVTLPAAPSGSLSANPCSGCPTLRLRFDAGTRYYIGEEAVSYARLHEAASKGDIQLYVTYRLDNQTLTRLRLVATGNDK